MRALLAPLRLAVIALHTVLGLALVLLVFPFSQQTLRNRIIGRWSAGLVALFGARLVITGVPVSAALRATGIEPGARGRLGLANHVSWIDIFAINAALPGRFVAKDEIGRWPLLGTLVSGAGTLYIERGRRHAVAALNHAVRDRLVAGETVVVFPEGTTTDGRALLPFHSNLVAPAIAAEVTVWPIALTYREAGERSVAAAFVGDLSLLGSVARVLLARQLSIEVAILPPIAVTAGVNRHEVARAARAAIAAQLGIEESAAPVPAEEARQAA